MSDEEPEKVSLVEDAFENTATSSTSIQQTLAENDTTEIDESVRVDKDVVLEDELMTFLDSDEDSEDFLDDDSDVGSPAKKRKKSKCLESSDDENESMEVNISNLCSTSIKRGTAFDSDSEPEDEYYPLVREYNFFVSTKFKSEDSVYQWFEANGQNFPRIRMVCEKLFVVPAASASSERLFSCAGNVITTKRSCLLPATASNLIMLASNSKILNEIYPK